MTGLEGSFQKASQAGIGLRDRCVACWKAHGDRTKGAGLGSARPVRCPCEFQIAAELVLTRMCEFENHPVESRISKLQARLNEKFASNQGLSAGPRKPDEPKSDTPSFAHDPSAVRYVIMLRPRERETLPEK